MTEVPLNAILLAFTAALTFAVGAYVLWTNTKAPLNRSFAFAATALSLWGMSLAYSRLYPFDYEFFLRFAFSAGLLAPLGLLAFVERFPAGLSERSSLSTRFFTPFGVSLSLLSFSPLVVSGTKMEPHGIQAIYGPLHPVVAAYLLSCFGRTAWLLRRKYRAATGLHRLQARYLFFAFVIPGVLAVISNAVIPLFLKTSAYSRFGPFASLIMIAMIGHAVIRHRLMDIRVVIRRSAVYATALLTSAAVFVLLLVGSNVILPDEHDFSLREIVLALAVAVCFFPVKAWVQRLFDHYLYRDPYDYQRTLRDTSRALTATIELPALLGHVGRAVNNTMQPESVAIYLLDAEEHEFQLAWAAGAGTPPAGITVSTPLLTLATDERRVIFRDELTQPDDGALAELARLKAEAVMPLIEEGEAIGLVVLGPKRSGDPYFSDDADLLTTLGNQSAVAIRNAQTHARALEVNEELQKILSAIESGVIAVGPKGRVRLFNRAAERLLGVSAEAVRGRPVDALPAPVAGSLQAAVRDGQPRPQVEFTLPDAAGQLVPLVCSTSPLLGPRGQPAGAVAVIGDLSRLKELEQERRRAERLASIEAIVSGMVHEVRNPLVAIKTFAQLLPARGVDAEFRQTFASTANREIGRIDELLNRFRTLSSASRQPMEPVDISEPLGHTLELVRPRLEQRQIRLRQVADGAPRAVLGNASQLEQLFLNLCLNAIEAMEPGGELTVRVADLCEGGGTTLLVEVSDTGSGIPEHLLDNIFEPFVTTKAHGTGLGLAVCRGIADAHHATLTARNNTERPGCTFTLEFSVAAPRPAGVTA